MNKLIFSTLLSLIFFIQLNAQSNTPKREFRAAWLSTVANIDWPTSPNNSTDKKKEDLIKILDYLKAANLNAVVFQIRPACDAMYASTIEPWSFWLTGKQGRAPSPFFDPLEFAVEEAHKRGMELHTWFNPYRVRNASWGLQLDEDNIAVKHPEWVLNVGGNEILNPGLPMVRDYVVSVITDVITRYEIDAVHFDDYFYLSGISNEDDQTFADYPNGFTDKGDWRRDNVNELLRMIYSTIQTLAPNVKFGQSPAGIWKNGVPDGIFGRDNYSVIYCDAVTWLDEQIIDYLAPQCYWQFDGSQDYGKLAPWWAEQRNERHIYPGLAYYRVGQSSFDNTQIGKMVRLNRDTEGIYGEVYFTAHNFDQNLGGITDTLTDDLYKYKALVPVMDWKDPTPPAAPVNLTYGRVEGVGTTALTWDIPPDDDLARYVIYRSTDPGFQPNNIDDPQYILDLTSKNYLQIDENFPTDKGYFLVTALDKNNNESGVSNLFEFEPALLQPEVPLLVFPLNTFDEVRDTVDLVWNYAENAGTYSIELARDLFFNDLIISEENIIDTSYQVTGLTGESTFYWRVKSINLSGESNYSDAFTFTTAFPLAPDMIYPGSTVGVLDIELEPLLSWNDEGDNITYRLQLSEGLGVTSQLIVIDTLLTDTTYQSPELISGTFYSWRVNAANQFGTSLWPEIFKFKTLIILPEVAVLLAPANNLGTLSDSVTFIWQQANFASKYNLQVAYDEDFTQFFYSEGGITELHKTVTNFEGETTYYWRVQSANNGGVSEYSEPFKFSTGFPSLPQLVYPVDLAVNVEIDPVIKWSATLSGSQYWLQLSEGVNINVNNLVIDTVVVDTFYNSPWLDVDLIYSWRVMAFNGIAESGWTNMYKFKTDEDTITVVDETALNIPKEYYLEQNYPNPFNPSTTITFGIPVSGHTSLKIYNSLGQQVSELFNEYLPAGNYKTIFDLNSGRGILPSGIYFYRLISNEKIFIKKMLLIK